MKSIKFIAVTALCSLSLSANAQSFVVYGTDGSKTEFKTKDVEKIEFLENTADPYNGHEYVDLGLPSGLKWATCNVGANSPEEYGDYFAWGATKPQELYDWVHTPYQTQNTTDISFTRYTKYVSPIGIYSFKDPSATDVDALKAVLDPEDDAAHVNWGGDWRMPTWEEQYELRNNCYWKWVNTYNGKSINGYIVYKVKDPADKGKWFSSDSPVGSYSVSDPHIFFPAAGYRYGSSLDNGGSWGYCWSSTLDWERPFCANYLCFYSGNVVNSSSYRYGGLSVRAVCP